MQKNKSTQNYYLQTMGINPWVLREGAQDSFQRVVILLDNIALNQEEHILLRHMLQSIGLDSTQVHLERLSEQSMKMHPDALQLPHPSLLLKDPIQKRNAYVALGKFFRD